MQKFQKMTDKKRTISLKEEFIRVKVENKAVAAMKELDMWLDDLEWELRAGNDLPDPYTKEITIRDIKIDRLAATPAYTNICIYCEEQGVGVVLSQKDDDVILCLMVGEHQDYDPVVAHNKSYKITR